MSDLFLRNLRTLFLAIFFILFFCVWQPKVENSSVYYKGYDARFFVDAGAYFQYYGEPKKQFSQDDFEILLGKLGKKDKELLLKSYFELFITS